MSGRRSWPPQAATASTAKNASHRQRAETRAAGLTSGSTAEQRYEADESEPLAQELLAAPCHAQQFLAALRTHGRDQAAALRQLVEQFLRNGMRRRRQQDRVERRHGLPSGRAVAVLEAHVPDAEFADAVLGPVEQRLDALDAVELADQWREHRGLVAAAGADLEDFLGRAAEGHGLG